MITLTILAGSLLLRGRHSPPKTVLLRGRILTGEQTIEATRRIELGQSRISSDASITLRAGTVALADGFSLDRGANLTIQAGNESQ